jgi:uncharacterized DUF497 family protein
MDFEWDRDKAQQNLKKHRVAFGGGDNGFLRLFGDIFSRSSTFNERASIHHLWLLSA